MRAVEKIVRRVEGELDPREKEKEIEIACLAKSEGTTHSDHKHNNLYV